MTSTPSTSSRATAVTIHEPNARPSTDPDLLSSRNCLTRRATSMSADESPGSELSRRSLDQIDSESRDVREVACAMAADQSGPRLVDRTGMPFDCRNSEMSSASAFTRTRTARRFQVPQAPCMRVSSRAITLRSENSFSHPIHETARPSGRSDRASTGWPELRSSLHAASTTCGEHR